MSVASVPLKIVLSYHADSTNEPIPVGYEVCDGRTLAPGTHDIAGGGSSYTLPDLRNRFILGADITKGASDPGTTGGNATDAPGPKGVGGANSKTLTSVELPSHTHTGTTDTTGNHTHTGSTTDAGGAHSHTGSVTTAGAHSHAGSSISSVANHSHGGSSVAAGGTHTHTLTDPGHVHGIDGAGVSGPAGISGGFNASFSSGHVSGLSATGITIDPSSGSHSHSLSMVADGGHTHTPTIVSDGDHTHSLSTSSSGSSHSHTISALSTDGNHSHSFTTNATGTGSGYDSRPRYYGLVLIMKVRI